MRNFDWGITGAVCFAVLVCLALAWVHRYQPDESMACNQEPIFVQGQTVDLRLGGEAQVLWTYQCAEGPDYMVRINTLEGLQTIRIHEFELCLPGGTYRE